MMHQVADSDLRCSPEAGIIDTPDVEHEPVVPLPLLCWLCPFAAVGR